MNREAIRFILGWILNVEAALLLLPTLVAAIYRESSGWCFVITIVLCLAIGIPCTLGGLRQKVFHSREGLVIVALSWLVLSIMGAIPFVLSGAIPYPVDALFETVSGFTTTGASILTDVEVLPRCILFWRSFTHWIGGMGILVFILSILPLSGGYHMHLMKAESPGPEVSKLAPRVQSTAKILYGIYLVLTVVEVIFLLLGRMPLFDALTTAFGTAGTGGFGIKNDSITSYSPYIQYVVTIFMILFGVNFNAYFLILMGRAKQLRYAEEVWTYLGIIAVSVGVIAVNTVRMYQSVEETFRHAAFQFFTLMTTTGFASADSSVWPPFAIVLLMFGSIVCACAGSTTGGIKVNRLVLAGKMIRTQLQRQQHPNAVLRVKLDGILQEDGVIHGVMIFIVTYMLAILAGTVFATMCGVDLMTSFSGTIACLGNVGPGFGEVYSMGNYAAIPSAVKFFFSFLMLLGRLEIFGLIQLFFMKWWR